MQRIVCSGIVTAALCLLAVCAEAESVRSAVPAVQQPGEIGLLKAGQLPKAGSSLVRAFAEQKRHHALGRATVFRPSDHSIAFANGRILINARAVDDGNALFADLRRLGLSNGVRAGVVVSGLFPLAALDRAVALPSLRSISASPRPITHTGSITSQGDAALRADVARGLYGVDGSGVTVGVISDAYDTLGGAAADIASGDLPVAGVTVLNGESPYCGVYLFCIDEGRAMLQIVYDLAPGANLLFHQALDGKAGYANAILALRDAGADVIVDDLMYLDEPMFQDGVVAQAVDTVVADGVAYFSAAGNAGRKSYESGFDDSGVIFCIEFFLPIGDCDPIYERVGRMHDFDPGAGVDLYQNITVPVGTVLNVALQWDEPFGGPGPDNDHDIVLLDDTGGVYFTLSANDNIITGEGWEVLQFENAEVLGYGDQFSLIITYDDVDSIGPPATLLKTVVFGSATIDDFPTFSSTLMGHANAAGAQAVGAAFFEETPEFGVSPPQPEPYSSAGGTPILFNVNGTPRSTAELRPKPDITAVDGVNTTFFFNDSYGNDGIDDFFGTSAAAPHAAAIAALMLEQQPTATPAQLRSAMQASAIDMTATAGFDSDTGAGLVQADAALAALQGAGGNNPPSASFDATATGLQVDFTDTSTDADGTVTAWQWNFGDGNVSSAQNPSHTYGADGSYAVTLTVTDDDDATNSASQNVTVAAGGVNAAPIASFTYVCSARDCTFDGTGSTDDAGIVSYLWDFGDGNGSSLATPVHSYASQGTYTVTLTVTDAESAAGTASASLRVKNRGNIAGSSDGGGDDSGGGEKGRRKCTDGIDNDGDGLVDGDDPDCQ